MQSLFQFTPLREGRRPLSSRGFINIYFNSRPSARGDETGIHMRDCARISIHAPPRGATIAWVNGGFSGLISIHAPPRGATSKVSGAVRQGIYFNSRPSARGDVLSCFVPAWTCLFQFTPLREGRRGPQGIGKSTLLISIHAPPRGATRLPDYWYYSIYISIHAPPRGATSPLQLASTSYDFNSRPSARGDNGVGTRFQRLLFQFTPLREGRRQFAEHTGR